MAFDAHKNLAIATVATAPSPASSGTSLTVGAGEGARFPAAPFNGTVWAADMAPDPTTAEVWRCTARAGDVLTLVRAQEGTTARAIVAGDLIAATITAKSLTDIESGVNFPQLATAGDLAFTGAVGVSRMNTSDAADTGILQVAGGGGPSPARGAFINFGGNESAIPGRMDVYAGDVSTGQIRFHAGGAIVRGTIHPSGGFSWGGTTDPGAGNLSVAGDISFPVGSTIHKIRAATPDGADSGYLYISGGGENGSDRGAGVAMFGNESVAPGTLSLTAGDAAGGNIVFYTGPAQARGTIHRSGGFSWGGTTDPGAGQISIAPGGRFSMGINSPGNDFFELGNLPALGSSIFAIGTAGSGAINLLRFSNSNGVVGTILTSGTTTTYNTTSDARLKTPLSRHTDTDVLRDTVIHNFIWKSDGQPGRGVFAQEAQLVAPFAVSVGSDEVDAEGRLTKPWGVDYSKYVPDLITGWQYHDTRIGALFADQLLAAERLTAIEKRLHIPQPSLPKEAVWLGLSVLVGLVGIWLGITP